MRPVAPSPALAGEGRGGGSLVTGTVERCETGDLIAPVLSARLHQASALAERAPTPALPRKRGGGSALRLAVNTFTAPKTAPRRWGGGARPARCRCRPILLPCCRSASRAASA